jgi:hypothetical protein
MALWYLQLTAYVLAAIFQLIMVYENRKSRAKLAGSVFTAAFIIALAAYHVLRS